MRHPQSIYIYIFVLIRIVNPWPLRNPHPPRPDMAFPTLLIIAKGNDRLDPLPCSGPMVDEAMMNIERSIERTGIKVTCDVTYKFHIDESQLNLDIACVFNICYKTSWWESDWNQAWSSWLLRCRTQPRRVPSFGVFAEFVIQPSSWTRP